MNDIVKRLRAEDPECGLRHSIAMEAADYIDALETAIDDWSYAIVEWEGVDFVDRIENRASRNVIKEVFKKKDGL
jgi:hypothetical protein